MNPKLVVLVAVTLLTSACSSFEYPWPGVKVQARDLGVRNTPWGKLHEYTFHGPPQYLDSTEFNASGFTGMAVVDLLVGPDGVVRDTRIVESSGPTSVEAATRASYAKSVFPVIPGYSSTEPYVVRSKLRFQGMSVASSSSSDGLVPWPVPLAPLPTAPTGHLWR